MELTVEEKKIVKKALSEMCDSMTRVESERDLMKNIVANVKENTTLTPKVFRKLARTAYKDNIEEERATFEEFDLVFEELKTI